jgi:hypothetical protein
MSNGDGDGRHCIEAPVLLITPGLLSNSAQVDQACAEARGEAEAAAEQRVAVALALERAELVKQARGLSYHVQRLAVDSLTLLLQR